MLFLWMCGSSSCCCSRRRRSRSSRSSSSSSSSSCCCGVVIAVAVVVGSFCFCCRYCCFIILFYFAWYLWFAVAAAVRAVHHRFYLVGVLHLHCDGGAAAPHAGHDSRQRMKTTARLGARYSTTRVRTRVGFLCGMSPFVIIILSL